MSEITETEMLNWLIRRSEPGELFSEGWSRRLAQDWVTEKEYLQQWRNAIRQSIKEEGHD